MTDTTSAPASRAALRLLSATAALGLCLVGAHAQQQGQAPAASGLAPQPQTAQPSQPGRVGPSGGAPGSAAPQPEGMPFRFVVEPPLGQWRASKLVGIKVIGANGENLGDIREAMVDPQGRVQTVVIGVGGVLGVGEKLVGVPYTALEFSVRNVAATRNVASNEETNRTGSSIDTTSTTATRDAFVTRGGEPDHAVLRVSEQAMERAPTFAYAGRSATTSAPQAQPTNPGVTGPKPATPPLNPQPQP
jgi:hypothetical protein